MRCPVASRSTASKKSASGCEIISWSTSSANQSNGAEGLCLLSGNQRLNDSSKNPESKGPWWVPRQSFCSCECAKGPWYVWWWYKHVDHCELLLTLQLHGHSWPIPPSELPFVQLPNISVQLQICPNKLQKPRFCTDLFSTFNQLTITFISTACNCEPQQSPGADAAWMVGRTVGLLVFPQVRCYSVVWIMLNSMRTHQSSRFFLCVPMVFPWFSHVFPIFLLPKKCGAGEFWPWLLSPGRSADLGTGVERMVNSLGVVLPMSQAYWWWLLSKEV
jgi:hypothetical protein